MRNILPAIFGLTLAFLNPLAKTDKDATLPELKTAEWVVETDDAPTSKSDYGTSALEAKLTELETRVAMLQINMDKAKKLADSMATTSTPEISSEIICDDGTCVVQTYESVASQPIYQSVASVPYRSQVYYKTTNVPVRYSTSYGSAGMSSNSYGCTGTSANYSSSSSYGCTGMSARYANDRPGVRGFFKRLFNRR